MAWVKLRRDIWEVDERTIEFHYSDRAYECDGRYQEYEIKDDDSERPWEKFMQADGITKVEFLEEFAQYRPKSCQKWLYRAYEVTHIEGLQYLNTSEVTNMRNMFDGCKELKSIDLSHFDTSKVTDMYNMFTNCETLESLDLSHFDTSNVTCMTSMFENCSSLKSLSLPKFNTAKVTDMSKMFLNCKALTSLNIGSFDVGKVTRMSQMFEGCSNLPELDITNFWTPSLTNADKMFKNCSNLATIYATLSFTTYYVTSSTDMFTGCEKLVGELRYDASRVDQDYATTTGGYFTNPTRGWVKYADGTLTFLYGDKRTLGTDEYHLNAQYNAPEWLEKRDLVTKVVFDPSFIKASPDSHYAWFAGCTNLKTIEGLEKMLHVSDNMREMFFNCKSLTSIDLSLFYTKWVKDMTGMFAGCSALTKLDISAFDTQRLESTVGMFSGCTNLRKICVGDNFVTDKVTLSDNMFLNCNNLRGDIAFNPNETDKTHATSKGGYLINRFDRVVTLDDNGTLTFIDGDRMLIDEKYEFTLNEGNNMPAWNGQAASVKKVVFDPSFANARPTSCCGWFNGAKNLTDIEGIENLNTSEVTHMGEMFKDCEALEAVDVSHFNTSKVTSMYGMFNNCSSMKNLELDNFDTSKVTDFGTFARRADRLETLFLGEKFIVKDGAAFGQMLPNRGSTAIYTHANGFLKLQGYADNIIPYVGINPNAPYGTICVPINGILDDGKRTGFDKLYRVRSVNAEDGTLTMYSINYNLNAGVPYIYRRKLPASSKRSIITFTADDSQLLDPKPEDDARYPLKGTFESIVAPAGSYILQTDGNFHPVPADNTTFIVGANRAYLVVDKTGSSTSANAKAFRMVFEDDDVTGIDAINTGNGIYDNTDKQPKAYFNLMGRRVNTPQKGNVYIVNGKKVIY